MAGSGAMRDTANPVGRGDPLEAAYLLASQAGLRAEQAYALVSTTARAALGLPDVRVEAGFPAELLAVRGERLSAVLSLAYSRIVIHGGRIVARTSAVREYCDSDDSATGLGGLRARGGPTPARGRGTERDQVPGRTVGGMRIVIAGGHGQIALRLERLLAARGDEAVGIIRNPQQSQDLTEAGAQPAVLDLESATVEQTAEVLRGADAAVFAAGAGPNSGVARKDTVDRDAAVLFADAAEAAGVRRYLVVSSMGADPDHPGDEVFDVYLRAKGAADADVRSRTALDWTILRPGMLTDDAGTGQVLLAASTGRGPIPRDDVAATLLELLDTPATAGLTLEAISGNVPVTVAVKDVAGN